MNACLDHLILPVNDLHASFSFYCDGLGFERQGKHGPFDVLRVSPKLILLLAEYQTSGGLHLAFSFDTERFEALIAKIQREKIPYGDRFDHPDNFAGPSPQPGAQGDRPGIYLADPSQHLIEARRE